MKKLNKLFSLISTILVVTSVNGQMEMLENLIDPLTGNLNYQKQLISVYGPNGESYPIVLSYNNGGIRLDQSSSEVGLGWSINMSQITRRVNGVPDDWNGVSKTVYTEEDGTQNHIYYGPFHFKSFPTLSDYTDYDTKYEMDVFASERRLGEAVFYGIDYDNYYVSAPSVSGQMMLRMFEYGDLVNSKKEVDMTSSTKTFYDLQKRKFTSDPKFLMRDVKGIDIKNHLEDICTQQDFQSQIKYGGILSNACLDDWLPKDFNKTINYNGFTGDISSSGVIPMGQYIKYFKNSDINAMNDAGYLADNFIEPASWKSTTRAYGDLVGAIQITDPNGMTYHFSLPEYVLGEESYAYYIDTNDALDALYASSKATTSGDDAYARAWKLVAITGPDFKDNGTVGVIDAQDEGYYISFEYGKVYQSKTFQTPAYKFNPDYNIPSSKLDVVTYEQNNDAIQYERTGSISFTTVQNYYLSSVETSTEKLLLLYGEKKDELGYVGDKLPELKLEKLVRINKADFTAFSSYLSTSITFDAGFNSTNINLQGIYSSSLGTGYESYVLNQANLNYTYELCQGYYNNIDASVSDNSTTLVNSEVIYDPSSVNISSSTGKLTLKQVQFLHKNATQVFDPTNFTYLDNNPNYDPRKKDNWGFYKYDQVELFANYTSHESAPYTDAWMLEKIELPSGAEINLEYESDNYIKTGYTGEDKNLTRVFPQRTFLIKEIIDVTLTNSPTGSDPREFEFHLKLDGDLPTNYMDQDLVRNLNVYLRYKGLCRSEAAYNGSNLQAVQNLLTGSDPQLGIGLMGDEFAPNFNFPLSLKDDIRPGKKHLNVFEGEQKYTSASLIQYHRRLNSVTIVDADEIKVKLLEQKYFANLYKREPTHEPNDATVEKIFCDECEPDGNAYDYTDLDNFINGYISADPAGISYGGGIRVKKATLTNLDQEETFYVKPDYGIGGALTEPNRLAHITKETSSYPGIPGHGYRFPRVVETMPGNLYMSPIGKDPFIPSPMVYYETPAIKTYGNLGEWYQTKKYKFYTTDPFVRGEPLDKTGITNFMSEHDILNQCGHDKFRLFTRNYNHIADESSLFGKLQKIKVKTPGGTATTTYEYDPISSISEIYFKRVTNDRDLNGGLDSDCLNTQLSVNDYYGVLEVKNFVLTKTTHESSNDIYDITSYKAFDPLASKHLVAEKNQTGVGLIGATVSTPAYQNTTSFESKYENAQAYNLTAAVEEVYDAVSKRYTKTVFSKNIPRLNIKSTANAVQAEIVNHTSDYHLPQLTKMRPGESPEPWIDLSEITLMDDAQRPLETYSIQDGIPSAVHYAFNGHHRTLSRAQNAGYFSYFFESFEDEVVNYTSKKLYSSKTHSNSGSAIATYRPHSGDQFLELPRGESFVYHVGYLADNSEDFNKSLIQTGKDYILQFWTKTSSIENVAATIKMVGEEVNQTINEDASSVVATNGLWSLVRIRFTVSAGFNMTQSGHYFEVAITHSGSSGVISLDDVSLRPADAAIEAFVYDPFSGELLYSFDNTNRYTRFEYDAAGRNTKIYKETTTGETLIKETEYHHEKY